MIITILPNSLNFHAVAYNEKKVEQGMAELIEVRNFSMLSPNEYSAENFRECLELYSHRNDHIRSAQFHVAISCKGQEYTHAQLLEIAHLYLREMGYDNEGQPLLVYAHHDTPNNHIHIITSRVSPDGRKINDSMEKKRSREITERIMTEYGVNIGTSGDTNPSVGESRGDAEKLVEAALSYRYTSKAQFCAILESLGYECKDDGDNPIIHLYKGGEEQGTVDVLLIMKHAQRAIETDQKRRRQLRAILQKYRNLAANKEELAAIMKRRFGISLVFLGRKDTPYGYFLVDHKNKAVFKGGEFLSIKELLQFEDAPTRFARIEATIEELLHDNPNLTTAEVNRILYRQFGTRIHRGTVSWNGETITLRQSVVDQLHDNYLASRGIKPKEPVILPPQQTHRASSPATNGRSDNPLSTPGGSSDVNRENEINGSMDMSVDNEETQRMKWRR